MNKFFNTMVIILIAVFVLAQVPIAQAASGLKKISLTYSDHSPPDTGGANFFKREYLPKVQKELAKIGYKLDVKYHHNETLYKVDEQVQACADGNVDITLLSISYETQRAPLHEIIDMPLIGFDEYAATRAWFDLQETIPEFGAEFGEFKELLHLVALPVVFNLKKEARVPEDFKGMKIQAAGMVSDMLKAAGADPVMESPVDWRASLENNRLDGIAMGITGVPMFDLQDVVNVHVQPTGDSLGYTGTSFVMNRKKFESFPPEVQKVINDNVLWASKRITEIEVKNLPKQTEICKKAGNTFISLSPTEMMKWYVTIRPLHQKWIRKMESMGLPGKKVYDEAKRLAEEYKNKK